MWLIQFHFSAIWKMKTAAQWTKILIRKQLYSSIFLRWLKVRSTWYCTHFRLILTLTLQTVCPRKFLCSQLAITCSIWARSKKSNCKGSGISWLKSIESRILKIFRRTRKKIKVVQFYLGPSGEEQTIVLSSRTKAVLCSTSPATEDRVEI